MKNFLPTFREVINLVFQLIQELQIEIRILMSWSSREKSGIFCNIYLALTKIFYHLYFLSILKYLINLRTNRSLHLMKQIISY